MNIFMRLWNFLLNLLPFGKKKSKSNLSQTTPLKKLETQKTKSNKTKNKDYILFEDDWEASYRYFSLLKTGITCKQARDKAGITDWQLIRFKEDSKFFEMREAIMNNRQIRAARYKKSQESRVGLSNIQRKERTNEKLIQAVVLTIEKNMTIKDAMIQVGLSPATWSGKRTEEERQSFLAEARTRIQAKKEVKPGENKQLAFLDDLKVEPPKEKEVINQKIDKEPEEGNPFESVPLHELTNEEITLFETYMEMVKEGISDKQARKELGIKDWTINKWRTQKWVRDIRDPIVRENKRTRISRARKATVKKSSKTQTNSQKPSKVTKASQDSPPNRRMVQTTKDEVKPEYVKKYNQVIKLVSEGMQVLKSIEKAGIKKHHFYLVNGNKEYAYLKAQLEEAKKQGMAIQEKQEEKTLHLEDEITEETKKAEKRREENPQEYQALIAKIKQGSIDSENEMKDRMDACLLEHAYGEPLESALHKNNVDPLIFELRKKFNVGNILTDFLSASFDFKAIQVN